MEQYTLNPIYESSLNEFTAQHPLKLMMNKDLAVFWPVRLHDLAKQAKRQANALLVIVNNEKIKQFLQENDPKALEQCLNALGIQWP